MSDSFKLGVDIGRLIVTAGYLFVIVIIIYKITRKVMRKVKALSHPASGAKDS